MAYKFSVDARVNTLHYNQSYKDYSDQNEGIFKENLKFQNEVTSELIVIGKKNLIFINYSSDSVGLRNVIEIQDGHGSCYVDLTWNDSCALFTSKVG
jgi:hypothetical protein